MEEQNEKACLIEEHDSPCIALMCIDKDCKQKSRTLCQQCIYSSQQNHRNCKQFVDFQDRAYKKLKIRNYEKFDFNKILQTIQKYENDILEKIEKEMNALMENLVQKISGIKKNFKIQIQQQYKYIKTKLQEGQNSQQETEQQLDILEEELQRFIEQTINIQALNQQLEKLQKSTTNQEILKQLENHYSNIKPYDVETLKFDYLKAECDKLVQDYQTKIHILNGTTNKYQKEIIPFQDGYKYFKDKNDGSYEVKYYFCDMRCKYSFNKNNYIQFQFRVNFSQEQNFYIGVCANEHANIQSGCYWGSSGNYYRLNQEYKYRQAKVNTGKKAEEVFKDGQIYVVEICIRDNLFKVSDIGQEWSITNEYSFEKQYKDWAITISMYNGYRIQIL